MFNEDKLVVQKTPNIRFHLPNNSNIGKRDTDSKNTIGLHYDYEFNHPKEEYNIILSITDMFDTNSLYIMKNILILILNMIIMKTLN